MHSTEEMPRGSQAARKYDEIYVNKMTIWCLDMLGAYPRLHSTRRCLKKAGLGNPLRRATLTWDLRELGALVRLTKNEFFAPGGPILDRPPRQIGGRPTLVPDDKPVAAPALREGNYRVEHDPRGAFWLFNVSRWPLRDLRGRGDNGRALQCCQCRVLLRECAGADLRAER